MHPGFFPACVYLVSCWYVRYEVQKRMAAFYLISVFVGGFSAILAYGLMQMEGLANIRGWSWIFIIEGVITCLIGILAYFLVIDFPDKLIENSQRESFLNAAEVEIIKARIDRDRDDSLADPLTWKKTGTILCDLKLWAFALLFMCSTMPSYALGYFMPIILKGMGFTAENAQLLTAPPYVFACIVGFGFAVLSDRVRMRGPIIVVQAVICIIGLVLVGYTNGTGPRYFGTFLGLAGAQGNVPAVLSYQSNNIRMNSKRAVASALQVGFGAFGGIFASTIFRAADAPKYRPGILATIMCQLLTIILVCVLTVHFRSENKKQKEEGKELEGHANFTYTV